MSIFTEDDVAAGKIVSDQADRGRTLLRTKKYGVEK